MFTLWTYHGFFPEGLVRIYVAEFAMVLYRYTKLWYVYTMDIPCRPDMTEKLLTGTLSLNTTNQPWTFHGFFPEALVRIYVAELAMVLGRYTMLRYVYTMDIPWFLSRAFRENIYSWVSHGVR